MRLGKRVSAPAQECSFLPRGFRAWLSAGGHASLVETRGTRLFHRHLIFYGGIIAHANASVKRFLPLFFQKGSEFFIF